MYLYSNHIPIFKADKLASRSVMETKLINLSPCTVFLNNLLKVNCNKIASYFYLLLYLVFITANDRLRVLYAVPSKGVQHKWVGKQKIVCLFFQKFNQRLGGGGGKTENQF